MNQWPESTNHEGATEDDGMVFKEGEAHPSFSRLRSTSELIADNEDNTKL